MPCFLVTYVSLFTFTSYPVLSLSQEPDLYGPHGQRPSNYSEADYFSVCHPLLSEDSSLKQSCVGIR